MGAKKHMQNNEPLHQGIAVTRRLVLNRDELASEIKTLSQLKPWRSLLAVAHQWFWIAASMAAAIYLQHWAAYILAGLIVATRQHALGVLMHEGVHYALHPNKKVNDVISNVFCSFPMAMSTALYRKYHLGHHRYLNTDKDPQVISNKGWPTWEWPKTKAQAIGVFVKDALGINTREFLPIFVPWMVLPNIFAKTKTPKAEVIGFFAFVVGGAALLSMSPHWISILALWFVPLATVMNFIFRIRGLAEHIAIPDQNELDATRTVIPSRWERVLIAPLGVNFHLEHHLFPQVPYFRLQELHDLLMKTPEFRNQAHLTETYFSSTKGLLAELTAHRSVKQTESTGASQR